MTKKEKLLKDVFYEIIKNFTPQALLRKKIVYFKEKEIMKIEDKVVVLKDKKLFLVSIGKSGYEMAEGIMDIFRDRIEEGIVITPGKEDKNLKNIIVYKGSHPFPDNKSLEAGKRIYYFLSSVPENSIVMFLVSGGGSDSMIFPEDDITLRDYIKTVKELKICGADIGEINIIRKKIDRLKGGKLRAISKAKRFVNIFFSDVPSINDDISFIASGPSVPDSSSFSDALKVIKKYNLENRIPERVFNFINRSLKKKLFIDRNIFKNDLNFVIAKNRDVLKFARESFEKRGIKSRILRRVLKDDIRIEAKELLVKLKKIFSKNICLIAGGEPVVKIDKKNAGKGGRMTHLGLLLVRGLLEKNVRNVSILTAGTDGIDGNSDISGICVDLSYRELNPIEIDSYIKNYDSASFAKKYNIHIQTGYTGINLADVVFILT